MTTPPLSPAAQAVLDATDYPEDWATRIRVAAALCAVADQVVPPCPGAGRGTGAYEEWMIADDIGHRILAIAAELENTN